MDIGNNTQKEQRVGGSASIDCLIVPSVGCFLFLPGWKEYSTGTDAR